MRKDIFKVIIIILGCFQLSVVGALCFGGATDLFTLCVFKYCIDIESAVKVYFVLCLSINLLVTTTYYAQRPFWDKVHMLKKREAIDVSMLLPDLALFTDIIVWIGTFKYLK